VVIHYNVLGSDSQSSGDRSREVTSLEAPPPPASQAGSAVSRWLGSQESVASESPSVTRTVVSASQLIGSTGFDLSRLPRSTYEGLQGDKWEIPTLHYTQLPPELLAKAQLTDVEDPRLIESRHLLTRENVFFILLDDGKGGEDSILVAEERPNVFGLYCHTRQEVPTMSGIARSGKPAITYAPSIIEASHRSARQRAESIVSGQNRDSTGSGIYGSHRGGSPHSVEPYSNRGYWPEPQSTYNTSTSRPENEPTAPAWSQHGSRVQPQDKLSREANRRREAEAAENWQESRGGRRGSRQGSVINSERFSGYPSSSRNRLEELPDITAGSSVTTQSRGRRKR
jgi:hypothetical protein